MKVFFNIILTAIAIVLAINILSNIEVEKVNNLKHMLALEEARILDETMNTYTLIPKRYGLDTVKIQGHHVDRVLRDNTKNGQVISEFTEYYAIIRFNQIVYSYNMRDYELQQ